MKLQEFTTWLSEAFVTHIRWHMPMHASYDADNIYNYNYNNTRYKLKF